jgi:YVTN family beta-propeller protein
MRRPGSFEVTCLGVLALAGCGGGSAASPATGNFAAAQAPLAAAFARPDGAAAKDILVLNYLSDSLSEFVPSSGELLQGYTIASGVLPDLTVAKGKIYVTDQSANAVYTYTLKGKPTTPTITEALDEPTGIAVDKFGKIYVTNQGNGSLTVYDANGSLTTPRIGGLSTPTGVVVDKHGKIYIANGAGSVVTFTPTGAPAKPTITSGLVNPDYLAVDGKGNIYVADYTADDVVKYTAAGTQVAPTITSGINTPVGLAVDAAGNIYVSNRGSGKITWYSSDGDQKSPTITVPGESGGAAGIALP